ncbi:hypothetical protein GYB59_02165 [bacterium]|nr:hypothetical protein [bacterium]
MEEITLQRTGQPPVRFSGKLVAEAAEPLPPFEKAKFDTRRWHELRLYRHQDGRLVLSIAFRSGLETETPNNAVLVCDSEAAVVAALEEYDPTEFLEGFPDTPKFEDRQRRLENRVVGDYEQRVAQLLASAGVVEEI